MARKRRSCPGGLAYHVMNRATARERIFDDDADYLAFERVLAEARKRSDGQMRICSYVLMPNHFHLVLWPRTDGALSKFMQWLTLTHAQRWHAHRHSAGSGALYGARFKSFAVREDEHFLKVCRYVERNPLRARLADRAGQWPWGSLHKRDRGCKHTPGRAELLDDWPVDRPRDWVRWVNCPESQGDLDAVRNCARRERPYGDDAWARKIAKRLGSEQSLRPRGRPRTRPEGEEAVAVAAK
ncbi:MAG TPA: transposase [Tepidisphaeraceae bacterium]|nr:transposase [Tepidisphaeraceae bacterium]